MLHKSVTLTHPEKLFSQAIYEPKLSKNTNHVLHCVVLGHKPTFGHTEQEEHPCMGVRGILTFTHR